MNDVKLFIFVDSGGRGRVAEAEEVEGRPLPPPLNLTAKNYILIQTGTTNFDSFYTCRLKKSIRKQFNSMK